MSARVTFQPQSLRPSACPSLFRLAPARDGGICRLKLPLGVLPAGRALAVAEVAERWGNGIIELTSRANLQLRGVGEADAPALAEFLLAAGLGPKNPGADDVRNVLVSPTHGIDPAQFCDATPIGEALLDVLESDPRLHRLSAKFSLGLSAGESTVALGHPHDLWFVALPGSEHFAFGFASNLESAPAGAIAATDLLPFVHGLLLRFLALAEPLGVARMRELLRTVPSAELLAPLGLAIAPPQAGAGRANDFAPLGIHPQARPGFRYVGARPALGRLDPMALRALADLGARFGDATLRLTPFQSILFPNVAAATAPALLDTLHALGLQSDPQAPLASMLACSGNTGCRRALADTQADARELAAAITTPGLHLSGCERSCAAAQAAPMTLLAVAPGRYDVYRKAAGQPSRFGRRIAEHLDLSAIKLLLG